MPIPTDQSKQVRALHVAVWLSQNAPTQVNGHEKIFKTDH
jgi:hypothetical protein